MPRFLVMGLVLALCRCLSAAPLADRLPGDAILYVGWQGSAAAAPAYGVSRLKQIADVSDLGEMRKFLQQVMARVARSDASASAVVEALTPVTDVLWTSPAALYVGPGATEPQAVLVLDAGANAQSTAARLQQALARQTGPRRLEVKTVGAFVAVGWDIDDHITAALGGSAAGGATLAANADFRAAMQKVNGDAALTVFCSVDALVKRLDADAESNWAMWRQGLNVQGIHYLVHTAGFDGKDWAQQTFIAAPSPRTGLAALLDQQPLSDDLLRVIPRNATLVLAGQCDLARILQEVRAGVARGNPEAVSRYDMALGMARGFLGMDLEKELAQNLGSEWALYGAPTIGGSRAMGWVAVNRLRNPAGAEAALTKLGASLTRAASVAMRQSGMRLTMYDVKDGKLTVHYLGLPVLTPAWAIQDGMLYLGLYPQMVVAAAQSAAANGPSILQNPAFAEARAKLGKAPATAVQFIDLPVSAVDGYGTALLLSRYPLGFADLAGVQSPMMAIPPLHKLQPLLAPSAAVSWTDESGWYKRGREPFPGSVILAGDFSMGAVIQPGILAAIVIPQFTNASEDAKRSAMQSTVQSMRSQIELYKLQHNDLPPDFEKYPKWEQLTQRTSEDGVPGAGGQFGPYIVSVPTNPFNQCSGIEVVPGPLQPGARATKPGTGWVFEKARGRFCAVDRSGNIIVD